MMNTLKVISALTPFLICPVFQLPYISLDLHLLSVRLLMTLAPSLHIPSIHLSDLIHGKVIFLSLALTTLSHTPSFYLFDNYFACTIIASLNAFLSPYFIYFHPIPFFTLFFSFLWYLCTHASFSKLADFHHFLDMSFPLSKNATNLHICVHQDIETSHYPSDHFGIFLSLHFTHNSKMPIVY